MEYSRKYYKELILAILILANLLVWAALWQKTPSDKLVVSFLDVGQGDAILIETPGKHQVLIDGGKNRQVLTELGKRLGFLDRNLDVVMATHPDADHIGGLPEVLSRYGVGLFIEPGADSDSSLDDELRKRLSQKKVETLQARRGQVIDFGDGVKLAILFPDRDVSKWDTNDASIVAKLVYGDKSFLLTGDSPIRVENILMSLNKSILDVDVLKAGHHGSRTSTSQSFASATSPEFAVISAGKDNSYGHPHREVVGILNSVKAKVLNTAEEGAIIFETDGEELNYR